MPSAPRISRVVMQARQNASKLSKTELRETIQRLYTQSKQNPQSEALKYELFTYSAHAIKQNTGNNSPEFESVILSAFENLFKRTVTNEEKSKLKNAKIPNFISLFNKYIALNLKELRQKAPAGVRAESNRSNLSAETFYDNIDTREKWNLAQKYLDNLPEGTQVKRVLKFILKTRSASYDPNSGVTPERWRSFLHHIKKHLKIRIESNNKIHMLPTPKITNSPLSPREPKPFLFYIPPQNGNDNFSVITIQK